MENKTDYQSKWEVNLEVFEGPLDLLLHLINKLEIDIYDIPISKITDQYLEYIHSMNILELDTAGNYLVIAATLMSIKSQLLVPRIDEFEALDFEYQDEDEDPREYLVDLLLEYRRFKDIAEDLSRLEDTRSLNVVKDPSDLTEYQEQIPLREDEITLSQLAHSFEVILNSNLNEIKETLIEPEEISVTERMEQLILKLKTSPGSELSLETLIDVPTRKNFVNTFLAVLELIKENQIFAKQKDTYSKIMIRCIN